MDPEVVIKLVNFYKGKITQKIMQKYHLNCRVRPKRRKSTGQPFNIVKNIMNVDFNATRTLEKLSTDITYLPFGKSMLYLSIIMDLYNREIIAYTISDKQDLKWVLDTLNQLPKISQSCILHSDQGSVYTAHAYQMKVKEKGITMSMSRPGKTL